MTSTDPMIDRFEPHRDRLFGVAYRMTGSVTDAEDCVQEAFVRWQRTDRDVVVNDEAFLVRTVGRLAIDRQRQTSRRRETYVGPWLPEPIITPVGQPAADLRGDPEHEAEIADSLSFAFLVMLDLLSASERAAFILHDVFGIPFDEISATLDRDTEACRQLASRARRKLRESGGDGRPVPHRAADGRDSDMLAAFLGALLLGDVNGCLAHLAPGVVLTSDAGAERRAARRHVVGSDRVLRLIRNLFTRDADLVSEIRPVSVNGALGLYVEHADGPLVLTSDTDDEGRISRIWIQMNPDKVRRQASDDDRTASE